jgi:hypothetical protein
MRSQILNLEYEKSRYDTIFHQFNHTLNEMMTPIEDKEVNTQQISEEFDCKCDTLVNLRLMDR